MYREDIEKEPKLKILSSSEEAGIYAVSTKNGRQIFITGHSEYDADTLKNEYVRDVKAGLDNVDMPKNYFPDNDRISTQSKGDLYEKFIICTYIITRHLNHSYWMSAVGW